MTATLPLTVYDPAPGRLTGDRDALLVAAVALVGATFSLETIRRWTFRDLAAAVKDTWAGGQVPPSLTGAVLRVRAALGGKKVTDLDDLAFRSAKRDHRGGVASVGWGHAWRVVRDAVCRALGVARVERPLALARAAANAVVPVEPAFASAVKLPDPPRAPEPPRAPKPPEPPPRAPAPAKVPPRKGLAAARAAAAALTVGDADWLKPQVAVPPEAPVEVKPTAKPPNVSKSTRVYLPPVEAHLTPIAEDEGDVEGASMRPVVALEAPPVDEPVPVDAAGLPVVPDSAIISGKVVAGEKLRDMESVLGPVTWQSWVRAAMKGVPNLTLENGRISNMARRKWPFRAETQEALASAGIDLDVPPPWGTFKGEFGPEPEPDYIVEPA